MTAVVRSVPSTEWMMVTSSKSGMPGGRATHALAYPRFGTTTGITHSRAGGVAVSAGEMRGAFGKRIDINDLEQMRLLAIQAFLFGCLAAASFRYSCRQR
jgi:hypothetical protein